VGLGQGRLFDGRGLFFKRFDGRDEAISTPRAVYDVLIGGIVLAKRAAKCRHLDGEIRFDDEGIRPSDRDKFALANQFSRSLDERDQNLDRFAAEANDAIAFE
jgi:hypothetical protein